MKTIKLLSLVLISSLLAFNCSKDDDHDHDHDGHDHDHEEELITTVTYTLVNINNPSDVVTFTWEDLDGDGPNQPVITNGSLNANSTYSGTIKLENKTVNPAEDVTVEVQNEGTKHEFFFINDAGLTITKTDVDINNNPLGIETRVVTPSGGVTPARLVTPSENTSGTITIILRHEPKKPNSGITDAGGSTDVQVTFNVTVSGGLDIAIEGL